MAILDFSYSGLFPVGNYGRRASRRGPLFKGTQRFLFEQLYRLELPGLAGRIQFAIECTVAKTILLCRLRRTSIVQLFDSGPIYRAQAHGTRLARGIHDATIEPVGMKFPAGFSNCNNFSMRCWIAVKDLAITARAQYFFVFDDHSAKRSRLFPVNLATSQIDCDSHITIMVSR